MNGTLLPDGFEDLESYVEEWALGTEAERTARRHASDMESLKAFHAAMLARIDDALQALGSAPAGFTEQQRRLHYLTLSLCEVAPAVDLYKQPEVVDGFERTRFPRVDIPHMTPSEL